MARQPRYSLPEQPQHIIQRGNNRTATFLDADDFHFYRECLLQALMRFECDLHAYALMTNHVHLLMSARTTAGISKVMQSVGRRYVGRFNKRHGRSGSLWEGRYRATIVDTDEYLFTCYRYVELNPVRACLVNNPGEYRWSSFLANGLGQEDPLVTPHGCYSSLGTSPADRQAAYRALFNAAIDQEVIRLIRDATNKAWALGSDSYRVKMSQLDRRAYPLARWSDVLPSA